MSCGEIWRADLEQLVPNPSRRSDLSRLRDLVPSFALARSLQVDSVYGRLPAKPASTSPIGRGTPDKAINAICLSKAP